MGIEVAAVGIGMAVAGQVGSANRQKKAGKAQAKAQQQANEIEQRKADIENQRQRRLAAMNATASAAHNIAMGAQFGGSSVTSGAAVAADSTLAGAIGASNTALAANAARAGVMQSGYDTAMKYQNQANNWGVVSQLGSSMSMLGGV